MSKDQHTPHHHETVSGTFKYLIYSPKGLIEGRNQAFNSTGNVAAAVAMG